MVAMFLYCFAVQVISAIMYDSYSPCMFSLPMLARPDLEIVSCFGKTLASIVYYQHGESESYRMYRCAGSLPPTWGLYNNLGCECCLGPVRCY